MCLSGIIMNLAAFSIRYKTVMLVLTVMIILGGIQAYLSLGKLEDPEYTIKTAVVLTDYLGATPREVEEEVTDKLEKSIRQMEQTVLWLKCSLRSGLRFPGHREGLDESR